MTGWVYIKNVSMYLLRKIISVLGIVSREDAFHPLLAHPLCAMFANTAINDTKILHWLISSLSRDANRKKNPAGAIASQQFELPKRPFRQTFCSFHSHLSPAIFTQRQSEKSHLERLWHSILLLGRQKNYCNFSMRQKRRSSPDQEASKTLCTTTKWLTRCCVGKKDNQCSH